MCPYNHIITSLMVLKEQENEISIFVAHLIKYYNLYKQVGDLLTKLKPLFKGLNILQKRFCNSSRFYNIWMTLLKRTL